MDLWLGDNVIVILSVFEWLFPVWMFGDLVTNDCTYMYVHHLGLRRPKYHTWAFRMCGSNQYLLTLPTQKWLCCVRIFTVPDKLHACETIKKLGLHVSTYDKWKECLRHVKPTTSMQKIHTPCSRGWRLTRGWFQLHHALFGLQECLKQCMTWLRGRKTFT